MNLLDRFSSGPAHILRRALVRAQLSFTRAATALPVGNSRRCCNLCEKEVRWFVGGRCAFCNSLPRHRLIAYAITREPLPTQGTIVHIGAIQIEHRWVAAHLRPTTYHRVDIQPSTDANLVADATALPLPDAGTDIAIAWHVLEHIPEDRSAMSEIFRVLRPGGTFFVSVPIHPKGSLTTFEDPTTPPSERARVYGFHEHVRSCGLDYGDRLRACGFDVSTIAIERCPAAEIERYGLSRGHVAWICRKPN